MLLRSGRLTIKREYCCRVYKCSCVVVKPALLKQAFFIVNSLSLSLSLSRPPDNPVLCTSLFSGEKFFMCQKLSLIRLLII